MSQLTENSIYSKRWALIAVFLGTFSGFLSAYLCIIWHLVIFGFNIMYIISPLLAGVVETFIARRKYGRSTGAISALLTFILINFYGWFLPGSLIDPTKEPATLSLITLIAIGLTIQAAFPILVNYILFVVLVGIFTRLVSLPARIIGKPLQEVKGKQTEGGKITVDGLTKPLTSVSDIKGLKIKKYIGLVTGEAAAEEKQSEGRLNQVLKIISPVKLDDMDLSTARKIAVSTMIENARSIGADDVIEVKIDYISVGGLQGSATIVTATGTAVILK